MAEERGKGLIYDPELVELVGSLNRQARLESPAVAPSLADERAEPPLGLVELLATAVRGGASDLLLVAGAPPVTRVDGGLQRMPETILTGIDIRELVLPLLDRRRREDLIERRVADFAFDVPDLGRFRANVHFERGHIAAALRALPATVPALESLGLPANIERIADMGAGLVLVVGPAGSGKTTTLAAVLSRIVKSRAVHAITIEEPIEYLHTHGKSLVEQVEIPIDCPSFGAALRAALRQSPDVLLVGEMRDAETMATALTAAETGHLVLASVHAFTAPQAIHRVMDVFPAAQQDQVRRQLALSLSGIVAQRLLPSVDGVHGRAPAVEVLWATDAVRNLIRDGRVHQLAQVMMGGAGDGMITLERSLAELVLKGRVSQAIAERYAYHPDELRQFL